MSINASRTLTVSIARPPTVVQAFITDPRNLPRWAAGLGSAVHERDGEWFVASSQGEVRVRFAPANPWGVIDHWVQVSPGEEIHVPMRVLPNGDDSEVLFTLFQPATMSADQFAADIDLVSSDLQRLKQLLEEPSP